MKSQIVKRSIVIAGHKTSVSLEDPFWKALKEVADETTGVSQKVIIDWRSGAGRGSVRRRG